MTIISKPKPVKVKKAKKPRRKKTSRQLYEIELDRLVREIVLLRDGFCVCPAPKNGHSSVLQPGHLITRGKESVRWDLRNVNVQCSGCNLSHEFRPEIYTTWYIKTFSAKSYTELVEDSVNIEKMSIDELMELREQLKEVLQKQKDCKEFKPRFSQKQILSGEWKKLPYALPLSA